jgi:hypothetical protein
MNFFGHYGSERGFNVYQKKERGFNGPSMVKGGLKFEKVS